MLTGKQQSLPVFLCPFGDKSAAHPCWYSTSVRPSTILLGQGARNDDKHYNGWKHKILNLKSKI